MADKHSSIILTVDLSCGKCHDKIKRVLSKYQDRWDRSVVWDEKNNKITLTGPFCPRKLSKKLCKKACKVIKSYDIPDLCECDEEKPKPQPAAPAKPAEPKKVDPPKPAPAKPAEPKKDDPPKPETPKPAPAKPAEPKKVHPDPKPENPKPAPPAPPPKADKPAPSPPQPAPAAAVPDLYYPPVWPVCFGGPWCQCGTGGGYPSWGCNCGCGHGGGGHGCGRTCHAGCKVEFFCEEDSSCRPM